ncbi:multicopper oxidase family protein [Agrococcus beijingensis]|uniref:multicopper oxidase family protein n=1 Tax=Agrococcus beijingensis TaxID=3068634 RepID=UPI0027409DDF|nr:multicopper oxidase domain-containing protein [Agrococcus sp. REN33]
MSVSRRQFLALGGLGVIGAAGALALPLSTVGASSASRLSDRDMPRPYQTAFSQAPLLQPYQTGIDPADGAPVNSYLVTAMAASAAILPRLRTPILSYNGTFPGPTIKVERGTKAVLRMRNQLPAKHPIDDHLLSISTHLHGSASLPQFDGYASDVSQQGFRKDYKYPNFQAARTLWYHDHAVHNTALNVYAGLAAQYHIHDPQERQLLPQGAFDVAMTVSDAIFAANGTLAYDDREQSGLWGDVMLVNGKPWPVMKVQRRIYRFRILNACISRSLRPMLSTGDAVTIVATDGGLMPKAQSVVSWRHASAERYEVLIDFRKYAVGKRIELRNLSNENNRDFDNTNKIMAFDVVGAPVDTSDPTWNTIPTTLAASEVMSLTQAQSTKTRRWRVKRDDVTNVWRIGETAAAGTWAGVVASGFRNVIANPELGATEIWEFENSSGGWFHPIHTHLVDFQILSRNGRAPFPYEVGPKDVVYVGEGETVRLLMKFGPHRGKYMVHCHNLPHEDHDMMVQFSVGLADGAVDANDPINAAKPTWDDGL